MSFEVFLRIVLKYSDLRWNQFRDDLIIKSVKILRKFREGRSPQEVLKDRKLSFEMEDFIDELYTFSRSLKEDEVDRVIEALKAFTKAPAPCKTKIIGILETMLGEVTQRSP